LTLPPTIGILGYGAIGKCFTDLLLENHPEVELRVMDQFEMDKPKNFTYLKNKVTRDNVD